MVFENFSHFIILVFLHVFWQINGGSPQKNKVYSHFYFTLILAFIFQLNSYLLCYHMLALHNFFSCENKRLLQYVLPVKIVISVYFWVKVNQNHILVFFLIFLKKQLFLQLWVPISVPTLFPRFHLTPHLLLRECKAPHRESTKSGTSHWSKTNPPPQYLGWGKYSSKENRLQKGSPST